MLILKRQYIIKTTPFFPILFFSNTYSSFSSNNLKNPPLIRHQSQNPSTKSEDIASSFKDWLGTSRNPTFDAIFNVLSSNNDGDLPGISHFGVNLNEVFVLEALNYKKDDILSCLKFFDWAGKQPNFNHTRSTCIALFKILSRAKRTPLMLELLENFIKNRHLHKVRPNDLLVIGYALAGKTDSALMVFGKMRFNGFDLDAVGYNILLNSLVEEGRFGVVKVVLDQIKRRGLQSEVTHGIVMKSLCKQGQLEEAEEYLRALLVDGKVLPKHAFGALLHALCKERKFSHAVILIEEFGEMGVLPVQEAYGVWIKSLVQAGKLDSAMEFLQAKKSVEGYVPEVFRYNYLICRLLNENRLNEVFDLLLDMKESQIVPDKVTMSVALCFFYKAGMMDVAMELYQLAAEINTPHSMMFKYVINALCKDGGSDEAYQLLKTSMEQGHFPGKRTFSILADALCREGKLDKMKDLIMLALEHKFTAFGAIYENFIKVLCRAKRIEDGYLIHGEYNRLDRTSSKVTYSYLICGFNQAKRGDIAARLLIEMQEKGLAPSEKLFKAVARCVCEMDNPENFFLQLLEMQCTRNGIDQRTLSYFIYGAMKAKRPELGRAVYDMLLRTGVVPSLYADLIMLKCYLRSGKLSDALNFFDYMNNQRKVGRKMLETMVVDLCMLGNVNLAAAILRQARNMGLLPSRCTYEELIKHYCSEKKYDDAFNLISDMGKVGRNVTSFIGNMLLSHSLYSGEVHRAWLRSRDRSTEIMPSRDLLGQLIAVFSGQMMLDAKAEDLEKLTQRCFPLNLHSYNVILRKLCINKIDEACKLFKLLYKKGYQPNKWTYETIISSLYKHDRIAEAQLWADEMIRLGVGHVS